MKKVWAALLLAAALALLAACGPGDQAQEGDVYYVGDTISTAFFSYTVNSAEGVDSYEGYTPAEGNRLVVVDLTIRNTESYTMPMFDTDFQIQWGDGENDWSFPVEKFCDAQFAAEYEIGEGKSKQGLLIYQVPEDARDFTFGFLETYEDGSEGDVFFTRFNA